MDIITLVILGMWLWLTDIVLIVLGKPDNKNVTLNLSNS